MTNDVIVPTAGIRPEYAHPGDAGADLQADRATWLNPGEKHAFNTGVRVAIPAGYFGLVVPRSGLGTKQGLVLANTVGIIDSGYRGDIIVVVRNQSGKAQFIDAGSRIAQLIIVPFAHGLFVPADELEESARGAGGFGSSGS